MCKEESPVFIYEVSHCSRCRGDLGTAEVQRCSYCKMDDLLMRYEARIFSLRTQTARRGDKRALSADDAAEAQEAAGGFAGGWGAMSGRGGLATAGENCFFGNCCPHSMQTHKLTQFCSLDSKGTMWEEVLGEGPPAETLLPTQM